MQITWKKKLTSYIVACSILFLTDVIGLSPMIVESLIDLTMIYIPSQAVVDAAIAWKGKKTS